MENPREETEAERMDRNLNELLQEVRIALPGVQVLFAFLLAVPFQRRFEEVTGFQQAVYFVTLLCTAASTFAMIAPTAFHRFTFRRQQKHRLLWLSNRLIIAGLVFLGLAVTGAITLVTDFLYGSAATAIAVGTSMTIMFVLWFAVPLWARGQAEEKR